jgi:hypothetical protein
MPAALFIGGAQRDRLQDEDEQREAHCQLREEVMERNCKGELQPING